MCCLYICKPECFLSWTEMCIAKTCEQNKFPCAFLTDATFELYLKNKWCFFSVLLFFCEFLWYVCRSNIWPLFFTDSDVGSSYNQWAAFFLVADIFVHGKTVHPGHTCHRSNWATVNFMKAHCAGKHCIKIAMPCRSFKCQVQWVCWQETSDSCCSTSILLLSHHTKTANISHLHNVSTTQILCPFAVIGSMCRGLPAMQNASVEYHN